MIVNKKYLSTWFSTLGIAIVSLGSLVTITQPAAAQPSGYCTHGNVSIPEDIGSVKATVLLKGDFDGDGKIDYFCKDIRKANSNGNKALEWLLLGNGNTPIVAQTNNWCTHKNSRLSVVRKGGGHDKLLCSDINTSWLRSIPFDNPVVASSPSISGEVTLNLASEDSAQCQNLKVNLVSTEKSPPPPGNNVISISDPIFDYSQPMSGDIKTGKCNYSITAFYIDTGKKAFIRVSWGGSPMASQPPIITIPTREPIKKNFEAVLTPIN